MNDWNPSSPISQAEVMSVANEYQRPILEPGATAREVYLPASAAWTDAWTGAAVGVGRHVAAAPADRIPVFVRDGAPVGRVFGETV